jgi:hypothetical protein
VPSKKRDVEVKIVIVDADRYRNEELRLARLLNDGWVVIGMCGLTPLTFVIILQRKRGDEEAR